MGTTCADQLKKMVFIPARLSSARLPGKGLRTVLGKPMLLYLVERLQDCKQVDGIALITSDGEGDDPLERFAEEAGIGVYRGPLEDVLGRFYKSACAFDADIVVRANGDSPWIDHRYVDLCIDQLVSGALDFVTGKQRYTGLPAGIAPECMTTETLKKLSDIATDMGDREHVTSYIFSHPESFSWAPLEIDQEQAHPSDLDVTVDSIDDFRIFEQMIRQLDRGSHRALNVDSIVKLYHQVCRDMI